MKRFPVVIAALLLVLGFASASFLALRQPLSLGDYLAVWGLKARAIHFSGELSSVFRVDPEGDFSHPAYPPLWPLLIAATASLTGRYDELLLSLLRPLLLAVAAALTFARTQGTSTGRLLAAATLTLLPYFQDAAYAGYAEALLLVLVLAALLLLETSVPGPITPAAAGTLLALAALTKQEGTVAVVVVTGILFAARRRRDAVLVGVLGIGLGVLPWNLYRAAHSVKALAVHDASAFDPEKPIRAFSALAATAGWPALLWLGGAAALFALAPAARNGRRALLAGAVAYVAILLASFAFSQIDVAWYVTWSWDRLALLPVATLIPALAEAAEEPFLAGRADASAATTSH